MAQDGRVAERAGREVAVESLAEAVEGSGLCSGAEREVAVVTFTLQRPEAELAVVGEAGYQETLDRFAGGRDEDGAVFPHHAAVLLEEPFNRFDRHAIAVRICDEAGATEPIGYLWHDDAVAYAPVLRLVSPAIPMCLVTIKGGWDRGPEDRRYHSAVLNVGTPAEMAAEWAYDQQSPRAAHPWIDRTVAFIGRSAFSIGGIHLDARAQVFLAAHAGCLAERPAHPSPDVYVVGLVDESDPRPESDAARIKAARQSDTPLVDEAGFWRTLGYRFDAAR